MKASIEMTPSSTPASPNGSSSRAWYGASIEEFCQADPTSILGHLARNSDSDVALTQRMAWMEQISFLQPALVGLSGWVFFEFSIPRMGRRIDTVILIGTAILVIEFKVGESKFDRAAEDQVWDYALDLKNFHGASHSASIFPILIPTAATHSAPWQLDADSDQVYRPIAIYPGLFLQVVQAIVQVVGGPVLDGYSWPRAPYRPTPTILEAARTLYAQHSVENISRSGAGEENLTVTSRRIEELVDEARAKQKKIICFVTGVPGAGKTLVGLNIATKRRDSEQPTHAVFLSGNGPLVAVLREALTRDEVARKKSQGVKVRKGEISGSVKAFIQNVHHFRDDSVADTDRPPVDHVVIFDEAQRAWNLQQTANFMRRKKNLSSFSQSEPECLISYMDRHPDWAMIVCLVGGGQEINTGEAGIGAWVEAVNTKFEHWDMYISSFLTESEYAAGQALERAKKRRSTHLDDRLHLAVSMRAFRAGNVSAFVKALLDCEKEDAREAYGKLSKQFPIAVTRDLNRAKQWIRDHARGTERYGLVASSKAQRLKPHAVDVRVQVNPIHYFLNDRNDTRSSYYLEDAATQFQVQGLELDWVCVTWDGDLRYRDSDWSFHDFRGAKWCNVNNPESRHYLRNAYRVLLTRARQGMVIFVPPGDEVDQTRLPAYYDSTFEYLTDLGIPQLG